MKKFTLIFATLLLCSAQTNKGYVSATVCALMLDLKKRQEEARLEKEKHQREQEKNTLDAEASEPKTLPFCDEEGTNEHEKNRVVCS
jgi:Skp family chaperone for outer membrane proteins